MAILILFRYNESAPNSTRSHYRNHWWMLIRPIQINFSNIWNRIQEFSFNEIPVMEKYGLLGFNSLWPSDAIWRQRSGSTLAQVMACCLTAPSHYLNQCWLIISKVLWHSSEDIITRRFEDTIIKRLKIRFLKLHQDFPGTNESILIWW